MFSISKSYLFTDLPNDPLTHSLTFSNWDSIVFNFGIRFDVYYHLLQFALRLHRNILRARAVDALERCLRTLELPIPQQVYVKNSIS